MHEQFISELISESKKRENLHIFLRELIPPMVELNGRHCTVKQYFYNLLKIKETDSHIRLNALRNKSLKLVKNSILNNNSNNINKLSHKIWLTSSENPQPPSKDILDLLKIHYNELSDYKHIFWTNNINFCKKIIDNLMLSNINIQIKNINELSDLNGFIYVDILIKNSAYAFACDICRIMVIYKYGGIYSDIGWYMKKYISYMLNDADLMFNGEKECGWAEGVISHNVIYAKEPKNLIFENMLKYFTIKENILWYCKKYDVSILNSILSYVSPRFIMVVLGEYPDKNIVVVTDNKLTFHRHHTQSYNHGTFGSIIVNNSVTEKVSKELLNVLDAPTPSPRAAPTAHHLETLSFTEPYSSANAII